MKIINFSAYDRPQSASTRSFDILRGLTRFGHHVILVTNNFCHFQRKFINDAYTVIDNVNCHYIKTTKYHNNFGRLINSLVNFWRILRFEKISCVDVVIGPSVPITTGFAAYFYAKSVGAKFIFEVRDVWPAALVMLGGLSKVNPLYWIYRLMEIFIYRNADVIVSALPSIDKHVLNVNPGAVIYYVPNPISNDLISQALNSKPFYGCAGAIPRVTYVGGFGLVHDTETLIRAAIHYINNIDSNVVFDFYGNGLKWNSANLLVNTLGLSDKIKLHGFISKDFALSMAINSDVLIAAVPDSPIFEFGINLNKLYLYMVAGPPIAFAGNIPFNIIHENNFGECVEANNHIELAEKIHILVKTDPNFRKDLKGRMEIYTEKFFSENAISSRYNELLFKMFH